MEHTPKKTEKESAKDHQQKKQNEREPISEEETEKIEMQIDEEYIDRLEEMKMYRELKRDIDDYYER